MKNFLNNLLNSISVSGYEEQVQDIVTEEMKEYTDEICRDEDAKSNMYSGIRKTMYVSCFRHMQMKSDL